MKKLLVLIPFLTGCTDAQFAKTFSLNQSREITCYSGAQIIYHGHTTGRIENEHKSDGYYFQENESKKLVETNAPCIIKEL